MHPRSEGESEEWRCWVDWIKDGQCHIDWARCQSFTTVVPRRACGDCVGCVMAVRFMWAEWWLCVAVRVVWAAWWLCGGPWGLFELHGGYVSSVGYKVVVWWAWGLHGGCVVVVWATWWLCSGHVGYMVAVVVVWAEWWSCLGCVVAVWAIQVVTGWWRLMVMQMGSGWWK